MATFAMLTKLTKEGYETMHHNPDRLDAVAGEIEQLGCKVVVQYALLGEWDVLSIIEAPDAGTVLHMHIDLSARGTSTRLVMAALTSEEFKEHLRGDVHLA
ncbi:GYD domain-containing protein [Mycolicibacterium sp. XJ662]